ncbi:MAG: tRNA pseudouridine(13) synthase TruD [Candidatus Nanohaloarchaea archaeon]
MTELPDWNTFSSGPRPGAELKRRPEDFRVEEIADHDFSGGEHLILKLRKRGLTTVEAVRRLSTALGISRKRIGFAGRKDRRAVTVQYVSVRGLEAEQLEGLELDGISVESVGRNGYISPGQLRGNRFEIRLRDLDSDLEGYLERTFDELDGVFPNYFGPQRFGSPRPVTHRVGREMLRGDWEEAVWTYIAFPEGESGERKDIRTGLWSSRDPGEAVRKLEDSMKYERMMAEHLRDRPGDYTGAVRRLPSSLQRLFIHAYQSWVFNRALSGLLSEGWSGGTIPLPGYRTSFRDREQDRRVEDIMDNEGIDLDDFRTLEIEDLREEGDHREGFAEYRDLGYEPEGSELGISFTLSKGVYATSFLREIVKF